MKSGLTISKKHSTLLGGILEPWNLKATGGARGRNVSSNVHLTLVGLYERYMDVETTSCASGGMRQSNFLRETFPIHEKWRQGSNKLSDVVTNKTIASDHWLDKRRSSLRKKIKPTTSYINANAKDIHCKKTNAWKYKLI